MHAMIYAYGKQRNDMTNKIILIYCSMHKYICKSHYKISVFVSYASEVLG